MIWPSFSISQGDKTEQFFKSDQLYVVLVSITEYKLPLHLEGRGNYRILFISLLQDYCDSALQKAPTSADAKSKRRCSVNYNILTHASPSSLWNSMKSLTYQCPGLLFLLHPSVFYSCAPLRHTASYWLLMPGTLSLQGTRQSWPVGH